METKMIGTTGQYFKKLAEDKGLDYSYMVQTAAVFKVGFLLTKAAMPAGGELPEKLVLDASRKFIEQALRSGFKMLDITRDADIAIKLACEEEAEARG